jgi:hypothetical protein
MNFFDHKDLGNHLLQLCPKVVKHPVYVSELRGATIQNTALSIVTLCDNLISSSMMTVKNELEGLRKEAAFTVF